MIYTVVCTDINDYINWQFELLEYSWSRINQPGRLIRLVSCDENQILPEHRHAEVCRTNPTNVHPKSGDFYPPYNRLYSIKQWLDEYDAEGTVLIIDADVVFRSPLKTEVVPGQPLGQHWLDYGLSETFKSAIQGSSSTDVSSLQHVTWPALIHTQDLRTLTPRWIELTVAIREKTKAQESDMFALLTASQELEIQFELGTTTAFMPWPDEKVAEAPLIHYCQIVKQKNGEELWSKGRYQPWQRVANGDYAELAYCRDLIALIDEFARLKNFEPKHLAKTIFIAIASYCEPEIIDTINSCLQKARYPENLRFGICHQFDNSSKLTDENCLDQFSQDSRIRYVVYDHTESKGGCWARNIAQQLYDGEDYTLQIDAHSRMVESWDTILIEMMDVLPSEKPLITQFPPLYTVENNKEDFWHIDDLSQVNTGVAKDWKGGQWIHHSQELIADNNQNFPRLTRFLSGAFVFTSGEWNQVVMQDDKHFYTGEEFALAIRSYTHGYDLFDPNQIVVWHRLHPQANRKYWDDNTKEATEARHDTAIQRLQLLFDGDPDNLLGDFGLGKARSLIDYYEFSGVDCINKTIDDNARHGKPPRLPDFEPSNSGQTSDQTSSQTANQLSISKSNNLIDITIHREGLPSLMLACEEDNPILLTLFLGLRHKSQRPNDVIFLDLGESENERISFKQSMLISIETSPPLNETFFTQLVALSDKAQQEFDAQTLKATSLEHHSHDVQQSESFADDWKIWIWDNVSRGCSKDLIFKQLVEHGFAWQAIATELSHQPSMPLDQINLPAPTDNNQPSPEYVPSPIAQKLDIEGLNMFIVDDFINLQECADLSDIIHSRLRQSSTVGDPNDHDGRTSDTCHFDLDSEDCALAKDISQRINRLIGINPNYAEPIQAHVYNVGEEYKPHFDWFDPATPSYAADASDAAGGQRTWSAVVYLNTVEEGGNTDFPNLQYTVEPILGRLVFWNNLNLDGTPSQNALHHALPVVKGQKTILTMWYRSLGEGPIYQRDPQELKRRYTKNGIERGQIPADLFQSLSKFYHSTSSVNRKDEFVEGEYLHSETDSTPSQLIDIPESLRQQIGNTLLPICERWSQKRLKLSSIYGIRVYARGTSLKMHTDTSDTHIISAIMNIAQEVDSDWPLMVEDHMFRTHAVYLNEGGMLLYEGARLAHGRPEPLDGDSYANIFVHFDPVED
jgi:prolyl 4-hydroxylase